jgi:hypothetical protein
MTSAAMRGYEPPQGGGEVSTGPAAEPDIGSAPDVTTDQAAHVVRSAKESGRQVASTAADEAKNITAEAGRQAKDLTQEVGNQAQQQAAIGKDKAANGLRSVSDELRAMARQGGQSGPVTDLAHEAADKVTDLATWLENRDPGTLLEEVRDLARRKPGTFLLGAAAAGVVAGRLTRGVVQASKDGSESTTAVGDRVEGPDGGGTEPSTTAANGGHATPYGDESTPIADITAAETQLTAREPEAPNGHESAGRPL